MGVVPLWGAIPWQDFGTQAVNAATPATASIAFAFTGVSTPALSVAGKDFSVGAPSCNAAFTSCTTSVRFVPLLPGLREDALTAKDTAGNKQIVTLLRGIGTAPRLVFFPGIIATFAGNGSWGYVNSVNPAISSFRNPQGVASDSAGNIYVADSINMVIRRVDAVGGSVTTVAGNGAAGRSGDGGPAVNAMLSTPTGIALDAAGNLYIADQGNGLIRRVDALSGLISTVAGGGTTLGGIDGLGDGLSATSAILTGPNHVALDGAGNIFIADSFHGLVRKVSAVTGIITVAAGGGSGGGSDGLGDNGLATGATLHDPNGIALDSAGNLYIADSGNSMVRMVNASTGNISVAAGTGSNGYSGDGGPAVSARLSAPAGVALDAAGNVYIADFGNSLIRQVSSASGLMSTLAGSSGGYSGDGGPSNAAQLNQPTDLAFGADGNLYIADYSNNVIRQIAFLEPPLIFPSTNVGTVTPVSNILLTNIGNANLSITSITLSAGFAQKPSGGTDCATSIPSGGSCLVGIVFAPTTARAISGSLNVASNDLNQAATLNTVSLSGTAIAGTPQANLSGNSLTFPVQPVGTASAAQNVTLTNPGTSALTISSIWLAGANAADFSLTTNCPASLSVSASCITSVTFKPLLAGTRTAVLAFSDALANSPQTVTLTGTGSGGPLASFNPASVNFGSLLVGNKSPALNVVVTNAGTTGLSIYGIALSGANGGDFSVLSTTCGSSLNPSANCTVSLVFAPSALGARTAAVLLTDSAGNSPQSLSLSGTGIAQSLSVMPSVLSFGSQIVGAASAAQTVTLANFSGVPVVFSGLVFTGPNSTDFSATASTCTATLGVGSSCSISLAFNPMATGARSASLVFTDSAGNSPQAVSLSGTGAAASLSVMPTGLNFGSLAVGTKSAAQSIILSNASGAAVAFTSFALAGANSLDFSIASNTCGGTLANGSSCSISLVFGPSATGSRSASLNIADNATSSPQGITLGGIGTVSSPAQASFQNFDKTTEGTWRGAYGSDGYLIANVGASLPSYANVSAIAAATYTWIFSTTAVQALQKPDPATDRIASTYYSASSFSFDVNLTDGRSHQLALYCLDFDVGGRSEKVSIMDAASGAVLDSESLSSFSSGVYAIWNAQGHVIVQVTYNGGSNAVASGLFFAPVAGPAPPAVAITNPGAGVVSGTVALTATATAAAGLASVQFQLDGANLNASLTGAGPNYTSQWATASASSGSHLLTAVATDTIGQKTVSLPVAVTIGGGSVAAAAFVKVDSSTSGSWRGVYGADGYIIANDSNVLPAYGTAAVNFASLFTWIPSTSDTQALQKGANAADRIASTFYAATNFTVDVNLTDGNVHQVALYCVDFDDFARSQTLTVRDAGSNAVLNTQSLTSFRNGDYLVWNLQGHVLIQVTNTGASNAVLSGIFFGGS